MQFLVNFADRISQVLMAIAIALAAVMMLHVTLDVILSQFIAEPMPMTVDLVSFYYMVGLVFLPLAFVETKNEHIDVDLIHAVLPGGGQKALDLIALTLSMVYFALLTYQSGIDALEKYELGEYTMGIVNVTIWPGRFFLPIGCGTLTLVLLLKLIRRPFSDDHMKSDPHHIPTEEGI